MGGNLPPSALDVSVKAIRLIYQIQVGGFVGPILRGLPGTLVMEPLRVGF